jgi:TIR domain
MQHTKPTIFFSHSSRDKAALTTLREVFNRKTGNTIDVFVSSDGQSIAFGSNWVHGVEDALARSKVMFVFLTPNATRSQWVPFEAGHAYGRKLRVVPVAMWGVDLAAIGPPLSLLQGFNVTSPESLSNIIAISNREFGFTHPDFTAEEYAAVMSNNGPDEASGLGTYGALVADVGTWLSGREDGFDSGVALARLEESAKKVGVEAVSTEVACRVAGMSVSLDSSNKSVAVRIDPGSLKAVAPLLNAWLKDIRADGAKNVRFVFTLASTVQAVLADHKITGRLASFGVRPLDNAYRYAWNDVTFSMDHSLRHRGGDFEAGDIYVALWPLSEELRVESVSALLELLFERQILVMAG